MPSPNSLSSYTFQDLSVHPDGQTDMVRSTRLVMLIKNIIYFMWSDPAGSDLYTTCINKTFQPDSFTGTLFGKFQPDSEEIYYLQKK